MRTGRGALQCCQALVSALCQKGEPRTGRVAGVAWGPIATRLSVAACFGLTALLALNVDLSPLTHGPPPPLAAEGGDTITLDVRGWLDNGTVFLDDRALTAKLGDGSLVPGLDD